MLRRLNLPTVIKVETRTDEILETLEKSEDIKAQVTLTLLQVPR